MGGFIFSRMCGHSVVNIGNLTPTEMSGMIGDVSLKLWFLFGFYSVVLEEICEAKSGRESLEEKAWV